MHAPSWETALPRSSFTTRLFLIGLLLLPRVTRAETPYLVRAWGPNDGLPTSTVNDIVQAPDGYFWVATTGGIARFDGVRFEVFGPHDGLHSSRFSALLIGRDGALRGLTEDGWLCRWDGARFTSVQTGVRLGWHSWIEGADGTLWGYGGDRLWRYRNGSFHVFAEQLEYDPTLAFDEQGHPLLTLLGQVPARVEGDRVVALGPGSAGIGHWVPDQRGGPPRFFRSLGHDAELLDTRLRHVATLPGAGDEWPQLFDARGRLWSAGGPDVIVRDPRDGRELERYRLGLTERARRVVLDADGDAWVCTETQGLMRVAPSPLRLLRPAGSTKALEILWAAERADGSIIATDLNEHAWRAGATALLPTPGGPFANGGDDVPSLAGSTRYRIGRDVLDMWDATGRRKTIRRRSILGLPPVEDPRSPAGLLTEYSGLVRRYDIVSGTIRETAVLDPNAEVRHLFVDRERRVWIATSLGLWKITGRDTTRYTHADGLPVDHVRQIHQDPDGVMWFGTYGGGLVRWKDGRFATLDSRRGLLEDVVSVVLEDDAGEMWLAGNRGIQHFPRRQANEVLDGRRARVDAVGLGGESGLLNPEGSGRPGLRTRDGRLCFPTFDGLAVVDPRLALELAGRPPVPHVASVSIADSVLARGPRGFVVPAGDGRFSVGFTGFDPREAEHLRFSYRLDGVDRTWSDAARNRVASYTNVPPGRHTFRLVALSATGHASTHEDAVMIDVRPHFWQTAWFLGIVALAAVLGFAAAIRERDRQLRAKAADLQRAVDVRTAELAREKARTEEQAERIAALDRTRSRFFASISHEFRTPLTLIQGPLHDVRGELHGPVPEEARRQVELALDSVTRLHRLVDQLMDAARAEAGELRIERRPHELVTFLESVALAFAPLAERKRITFERGLPPRPVLASFDVEAMEKVFANLLGNAFKFTPAGGHVTLSAALVANASPPAIEIAIRDDGPGIAAEDLPHVFKRFYRAERSVTRMQPGTGLGLALAADMVEQHGGTLRVESVESHGSTFTVRLELLPAGEVVEAIRPESPAVDAAMVAALADEIRLGAAAEPASAVAEGVREDGPCILVVDDHPGVRAYVSRHLRRRYRVVEAADGIQALAAMRSELPDLVVSDVSMPEMDGNELVRQMRGDPELDFVPVLLLTAAASPERRIAGLEGGADDYLTKPFEMRELLARVEQALESRRRLRDRIARSAAAASLYGAVARDAAGAGAEAPAPAGGAAAATPSALAEIRAAAADSAFARRLREVIEARMGDEDFDVDRLAEAMGMGRSTFFEKVAETMHQTPMALVMTYRLERAAQMLRAGEGNVGEVAYAVGFRSLSHFTRRFREHRGVTPSACRPRPEVGPGRKD